jgi:hypothetical protein
MKITIEQLEELGRGCEDGRAWFLQQKDKDIVALLKAAIAGGENTQNYANWGLTRLMSPQQRALYARFAARQTLSNYTKVYPGDNRVLGAIEAAEKWALDPSEANRSAARSAESAAESAAKAAWARSAARSAAESAAWSAAEAAESAAWSAAESAARSAESAARSAAESAARSAAESAARSAARSAAAKSRVKCKILRYGAKLLLEKAKGIDGQ